MISTKSKLEYMRRLVAIAILAGTLLLAGLTAPGHTLAFPHNPDAPVNPPTSTA